MPGIEHEYDDDCADWDADDPNAPQECDLAGEDEDDTPTEACPSCGREVADSAPKCPYCGEWIVAGAGPRRRDPWFLLIVLLALAIVLAWALI